MLLGGLLIGFLLCAAMYSLVVPLWEASDESEHFQYVVYLLQRHALPTRLPTIQPNGNNEGNQPPLYYLLAAPLAAGVDLSGVDRIRLNPQMGWHDDKAGIAAAAHLLDEGWPYHGIFLAAHRIRLLSVLLGAATTALTYGIAHLCTGNKRTALFAATLIALLPGFLFASATIDNDALINALTALLLFLTLRATPAPSRRFAAAYGLICCLALLTKLHAVVPIAVGITTVLVRSSRPKRAEVAGCISLPLIPAGVFWLWRFGHGQRNLIGDRVTWPPPLPGSTGPLDWSVPWRFTVDVWTSFYGVFGRQNVFMPWWLYLVYSVLFVGGLVLAAVALRRLPITRMNAQAGLLLSWTALVFGAIVVRYFMLTGDRTGYDSSRFLYPALPAVATLVAYGWSRAGGMLPRLRTFAAPAFAAGTALLVGLPWLVIRPAYVAPYPIGDSVPVQATSMTTGSFAQSAQLAAVELPATPIGAGQGVFLRFYWRVQRPLPDGDWLFVHVEDDHGRVAAAFDGVPLSGTLPLSYWRRGDVITDQEVLTIHNDAVSGSYAVKVGWYNPKTGVRLPLSSGGNEVDAGRVQVLGR